MILFDGSWYGDTFEGYVNRKFIVDLGLLGGLDFILLHTLVSLTGVHLLWEVFGDYSWSEVWPQP